MDKTVVLSVDDEPTVSKLIETICENAGFDVHCVNSGKEALERLKDIEPTVVLMDLNMPDMDGIETVKQIRSQFPDLVAPMIFLTASRNWNEVGKISDVDGTYLMKPVTPRRLVDKINDVIGGGSG